MVKQYVILSTWVFEANFDLFDLCAYKAKWPSIVHHIKLLNKVAQPHDEDLTNPAFLISPNMVQIE